MESLHDRVAAAVHTQYSLLGPTAKPQTGEWTVLAGIVLSRPTGSLDVVALATGTKCLSIDAIAADVNGEAIHDSHAEVSARRAVLLYLYKQLQLIGEGREDESILCRLSSDHSNDSSGGGGGSSRGSAHTNASETATTSLGFRLRPGHSLHFYSSQPPCGDASIFGAPVLEVGDPEMTKKRESSACDGAGAGACSAAAKRPKLSDDYASTSPPPQSCALPFRGFLTGARPANPAAAARESVEVSSFGCRVGLARTKPGRSDGASSRTSCMSCSDKLARWHALGLQGALLSFLLPDPIRFESITVGSITVGSPSVDPSVDPSFDPSRPEANCAEANCADASCLEAIKRAVLLRLPARGNFARGIPAEDADGTLLIGIAQAPFSDGPQRMCGSKIEATSQSALRPCANSLIWFHGGQQEGINGLSGKRLGANKNKPSPKHRVSACKALLCARFRAIAEALPFEALPRDVRTVLECGRTRGDSGAVALSYSELKGLSAAYQRRKMALLGTDNFLDWVTASPTCESFSA